MLGLKYMITVTERDLAEDYIDFFHRHKVEVAIRRYAKGTATKEALDLLGLQKTKKIIFQSVIRDEQEQEIKKGLISEMDIKSDGNGIAVFLPFDGIGGESSKKYLLGDEPITKKENTDMELSENVMIIAVCNKGCSETVMDAAKEGGAGGGTVVHAYGTGKEVEKFFGVSMATEKEMVYIVARRSSRDAIMHNIMEKAGHDTPSKAIVFSLPVDSVIGIRAFEKID